MHFVLIFLAIHHYNLHPCTKSLAVVHVVVLQQSWYQDKDYPLQNPSEVRDVSGAGDTFLASFSYAYTATQEFKSSILFAQECCQDVVRKKGVTTI